jgi:hypothetical protein
MSEERSSREATKLKKKRKSSLKDFLLMSMNELCIYTIFLILNFV